MLLALLGLVTPASLAFAPTDDVWLGIEPARTMRVHASRQARLAQSSAWRAFTDGEGYGWRARFDEGTGTAWRAWGPGIDLGTLASAKQVDGAMRQFLARNEGLVAVPLEELALRRASYVARTDTWYVEYDRKVAGARIWRGGVTARIKHGVLVLFGIETYPELRGVEPAELDAAAAIEAAELLGPAAFAVHTDVSAEPVILPREVEGRLTYALTWEVRSRTKTPPGRWVSHVDARTGELLNVYNEVRFLDGTLWATHDTRTVNGDFSTSPVPLADISGASSGGSFTTGTDGSFSVTGDEAWVTQLRGDYVTVRNEAGNEGSLSFSTASPTWTEDDATLAEIDSYIFLHHVRDWGLVFAPEVPQVTEPLRSNVNLGETCNAYWNGDVNFYQEGGGCNNTGRIADVNYHEWGHGFHYYSLEAGDFDGSISEGIGDVVSVLLTLDPEVAPYFGTNGGSIREVDSDRVYPDDVVGEVHEDGLIFGGAVWDLYLALSETYGEAVGTKGTAWAVTSQLFADAIKAGPTIPESYDEFVLADDDNGDLSDGTPHQCELIDAFGMHGLGPNGEGSSLLQISHASVGNQPSGGGIALSGDVLNTSPACVSFELANVDVVYSTDAGVSWDEAPLSVSGDSFSGAFPSIEAGNVVWYYLRAQGVDGNEVTLPAGGEIAPYSFFVGGLEEIYCEPFDDDGGYEHALLDGTDQRGADDWDYGEPGGYSSDPADAYTGRNVWGNDLGGGQYNGDYQASVVNRLTSPSIDLGGADAIVIQFRRWLNVEDGVYDRARVYLDEDVVWQNYETSTREGDAHTEDSEWILHTILAEPAGSSVTLGWEIDSDGGLEFGGWNIDDVCVYRLGPAEPDDTGTDGDDTGPTGDELPDDLDGDDDPVVLTGGCGCDVAGNGVGVVAALAGALAVARRRRRG